MKRLLLIIVSFLAAAAAIVVPAVMGLAGNPSFSHQLPVRVPSQARSGPVVLTDDLPAHRSVGSTGHRDDRRHERRHLEPGDDRGRAAETHARDDRGRRHHDAERGRSEHRGHNDGGSGDDHHGRDDDGGA